jgi:hypothetical protein
MARVFEDEVSILRSAKLDLLVYTDEIGSAGAAMSPRDPLWSAAISPGAKFKTLGRFSCPRLFNGLDCP